MSQERRHELLTRLAPLVDVVEADPFHLSAVIGFEWGPVDAARAPSSPGSAINLMKMKVMAGRERPTDERAPMAACS